jgi:hypothetical protein
MCKTGVEYWRVCTIHMRIISTRWLSVLTVGFVFYFIPPPPPANSGRISQIRSGPFPSMPFPIPYHSTLCGMS